MRGLAADRTKWRSAIKQHLKTREDKLMTAAADKRAVARERFFNRVVKTNLFQLGSGGAVRPGPGQSPGGKRILTPIF